MGILTEPLNGVGEPGEFYVYVISLVFIYTCCSQAAAPMQRAITYKLKLILAGLMERFRTILVEH